MYNLIEAIEEAFEIAAEYAPATVIIGVSTVATLMYFLTK
jgi:hypothetical protein